MSFTTIDTDVTILSSLTLHDLRQMCQTNQHWSTFCKTNPILKRKMDMAKLKVEQVIDYIDKQINIVLQPYDIIQFKQYHTLINRIGMHDVNEEESDSYEDIMDDYYSPLMTVYKNKDDQLYTCSFYCSDRKLLFDVYNAPPDITSFHATLPQLKEFLLHLIYDRMIFTF